MLGVFIALSYGWYRYYSVNCNFVPNITLLASFLVIEGVSIATGFVYNKLLTINTNLIWTSFLILPAVLATFLVFMANWQNNDFFFYSKN